MFPMQSAWERGNRKFLTVWDWKKYFSKKDIDILFWCSNTNTNFLEWRRFNTLHPQTKWSLIMNLQVTVGSRFIFRQQEPIQLMTKQREWCDSCCVRSIPCPSFNYTHFFRNKNSNNHSNHHCLKTDQVK